MGLGQEQEPEQAAASAGAVSATGTATDLLCILPANPRAGAPKRTRVCNTFRALLGWAEWGGGGEGRMSECGVYLFISFSVQFSPRLPRLVPSCGASRGVARSVGWRFLSHQLYHFPSPDRWATLLGRHCRRRRRRRRRRCCVSVVRAKFQLICRLFSPLYFLLFLYLVVGIWKGVY